MRMDAQGHKADALEQRRQLLLAAGMAVDHLDPQHCLLALLMDLAGNPLLARYPPKQPSQPHAAGTTVLTTMYLTHLTRPLSP